jgi:hypothetical protein
MKSRLPLILLVIIVTMVYQSCDNSLSVDKPKDFYKYIGMDGNQTGVDLVTDTDGNAYVLGSSTIASEGALGQQIYVVMADPKGDVVWSKTYGDDGDEVPKDIEMLTDGTLVVLADRSDGDYAVYHLDRTSGAQLTPVVISGLEKVLQLKPDTTTEDHANSITQTSDGFIVAAYTNNGSYNTALIARYYADMTSYPTSWDYQLSQFKGADGYDFIPVKVFQVDATNFITFGYTNSTFGGGAPSNYNFFILPTSDLNSAKNTFFFVDADPVSHPNERLTSVRQAPIQSGGGYILTGYTSSNGSSQDIFVAKVVQDLGSASQATFLGKTRTISSNLSNLSGASASVYASALSGFYVLGNQGVAGDNNLYLTKLDTDLSDAWGDGPARTFGGVGDDAGGAVAETADGRVLVVGTIVLGDLKGQRKLVLMNLNSEGFFGN